MPGVSFLIKMCEVLSLVILNAQSFHHGVFTNITKETELNTIFVSEFRI
jgi:hypothetical protein